MKRVYFFTVFLLSIILFVSSCRTVQVKENTPVSDNPQNTDIAKVTDVTPENIIITPEVVPEKPKVSETPRQIKSISKTAMETFKAAPAKVLEVSNKIADRVKVETKNSLEYWPLLLMLFVVIIVGYFMYDSNVQKPVKRRKKKAKTPGKSKK
ncbi:MAG: hypothetical protein A2231_09945 [Candidatus Firestonebacteria bacterium RIFOXYA2_FULL_40_8]|nr:MAG: hypothetical protein A2231_09945 [Candidatus Firestonebacteria bacterium RIFOXYA2_FULL_40_8]